MDRRARLGACLLLLLVQLALRAEAECRKADNADLIEYHCEGGSIADLDRIPDNVEKIRIMGMPVVRVTESTFARFGPSLLVLACSHCNIEEIDEQAFRRLTGLQQLSLDNNRLKEVRAAWFKGLGLLTYLDLNQNRIERIEPDVFGYAPDLVDLRVSGNRLECIDVASLSRLQGLKRIFLNENPDFGCPNALKRFLAERHVDFEADPEWSALTHDRVSAGESAMPETTARTAPPAYTRPRWSSTEEPMTEPPPPVPTEAPSPPPRRPYIAETIQPAVPDSNFSLQGPYYPPEVTQQQIDDYRHRLQQNATTAMTGSSSTTNATTPKILLAGQQQPSVTTTTECPNSATSVSSGLLGLLVLLVSRWAL